MSADRPVDLISLTTGAVFVVLAVAFAAFDLDTLGDQLRFVWPLTLVGLGGGLLLLGRRT